MSLDLQLGMCVPHHAVLSREYPSVVPHRDKRLEDGCWMVVIGDFVHSVHLICSLSSCRCLSGLQLDTAPAGDLVGSVSHNHTWLTCAVAETIAAGPQSDSGNVPITRAESSGPVAVSQVQNPPALVASATPESNIRGGC